MRPLSSAHDRERSYPTESKSSRPARPSRFLAPGTFSDNRGTARNSQCADLPDLLRRSLRDDDRPRFDRTDIRSAGNATDCHSIHRRASAGCRGRYQSTGPWPAATRKPGSSGGASAPPDAMRQRRRRPEIDTERAASNSGTASVQKTRARYRPWSGVRPLTLQPPSGARQAEILMPASRPPGRALSPPARGRSRPTWLSSSGTPAT